MTAEAISYIGNILKNELDLPYAFMTWDEDIVFPYWVGEYVETIPMDEDGRESGTFIITGTTDGSWLSLEMVKQQIHDHFSNEGLTDILSSGSGIAVAYESGSPIPSEDETINRMEIHLNVQEWRI